MNTMKPRVFVSSVIEGFKEYRNTARRAITAANGEPVLAEDFPSLSVSPRNACLDGVESSDIFILIVGERGGYIAPSGKLVVQEEYEEAIRKKLKILIFIQKVEHDKDAEMLIRLVSDYVHGNFRLTFGSPEELETAIIKSLQPAIKQYQNKEIDMKIIQEKLEDFQSFTDEACLRFVIAPERSDEHIDPVELESNELKEKLLALAHDPKVRIFSYENPKSTEIEVNEIIIFQDSGRRSRGPVDTVRISLSVEGCFVVDINVTGISDDDDCFSLVSMVVLEADVISRLNKCFAFVGAYFELVDPAKRYDRMYFNAALYQLGHRNLVAAAPKGNGVSIAFNDNAPVPAFEKPRLIVRQDLLSYKKQVDAILSMFRRRLKRQ